MPWGQGETPLKEVLTEIGKCMKYAKGALARGEQRQLEERHSGGRL
jgi:hypothetical protein